MRIHLIVFALAVIFSFGAVSSASGDIKVKTRTTTAGASFEGTTYIKGARQRTSQNVGGAASFDTIYQCDLKRVIQINDRTKKYLVTPLEAGGAASEARSPKAAEDLQPRTRKGGVITYTTTINDTGERKEFFGFKARRVKTTMVAESSPDACNPSNMRVETDGWYIDLEYGLYCSTDGSYVPQAPSVIKPECQDEIRFKTSGSGRLGYPVLLTTTIFGEGGRTTTTTMEVVELSSATLDASLFEIPAGYSQAKDYKELMGISSA